MRGFGGPFVGRAFHGAGRDRPGRAAASEQIFTLFFRRLPMARVCPRTVRMLGNQT